MSNGNALANQQVFQVPVTQIFKYDISSIFTVGGTHMESIKSFGNMNNVSVRCFQHWQHTSTRGNGVDLLRSPSQ